MARRPGIHTIRPADLKLLLLDDDSLYIGCLDGRGAEIGVLLSRPLARKLADALPGFIGPPPARDRH